MKRLEEFADAFELGRTTVYSLSAGRVSAKGTQVKPSIDTLVKLANALETPLHDLAYELAPDAYGADTGDELPDPTPVVAVPCHVAGWIKRKERIERPDIAPSHIWIERTYVQGRNLLAFQVRGDAMEGGRTPIKHGDIVLIDRGAEPNNNTPVIAKLVEDRVVCKLFKTGTEKRSAT